MKTTTMTFRCLSLLFFFSFFGAHAQSWTLIGPQDDGFVNDIIEFNGDIYITGSFEEIDGVVLSGIARWNGTSWESVGGGLMSAQGFSATGNCLEIFNNELYVGGNFSEVDNGTAAVRIAKWNGSTWSNVGSGLTMMGVPHELVNLHEVLYIGGSSYAACNTPNVNIVQWNGLSYATVGSGELQNNPSVISGYALSMCEHDGGLYVGGVFNSIDGVSSSTTGVAHWDGNSWQSVPQTGLSHQQAMEIASVNGELSIALGNNSNYWLNGSQWEDYLQGYPVSGYTSTMIGFMGTVVMGGFYHSSPLLYNGVWQEMGSLSGTIFTESKEIGNELYVVGYQNFPGTGGAIDQKTLVMKWSGALENPELSEQLEIEIYPNPSSDQVTLLIPEHSGDSRITVLDLTGSIMNSEVTSDASISLDVSKYPRGSYVICVSNDLITFNQILLVK